MPLLYGYDTEVPEALPSIAQEITEEQATWLLQQGKIVQAEAMYKLDFCTEPCRSCEINRPRIKHFVGTYIVSCGSRITDKIVHDMTRDLLEDSSYGYKRGSKPSVQDLPSETPPSAPLRDLPRDGRVYTWDYYQRTWVLANSLPIPPEQASS